jgi:hypothetical protein
VALIILLGTVAIAVPFLIAFVAPASLVGAAVSARFLERSASIPPEPQTAPVAVNESSLRAWVTSADTAAFARAYARRVMPLDFLYLLALGGFLAMGAYALAGNVDWPPALASLPRWTWLILPLFYTLADFAEDCLIVLLMTSPSRITKSSVDALSFLRKLKIASSALSILQILALGLAAMVWP